MDDKLDNTRSNKLGKRICEFAEKFSNLDRKSGEKIKDHSLKIWHDEQFLPFFEEVVTEVSHGRLKGYSRVNVGGNWYRIPNILAFSQSQEPWANPPDAKKGRLLLQIHFSRDSNSEDFNSVFFSIVLHYHTQSITDKKMPQPATQRFQKLLECVKSHSTESSKLDLEVFHHWTYEKTIRWAKPLMTYKYSLNSLPDDEHLYSDLEHLANVFNEGLAIS